MKKFKIEVELVLNSDEVLKEWFTWAVNDSLEDGEHINSLVITEVKDVDNN